jgi:catechol 2,3-dioxygenase-like lactoylglutathione lyase family enzyme
MRLVVTAEDYDAALHFYRDVLGLPNVRCSLRREVA